ncbi:MAG: imidazolonepropionase related amidohydrolase [Planctomycetota bacterium]|nr:MAG: imidazolonepropionase related amidohydrolase [Planctomycetota bacterium]
MIRQPAKGNRRQAADGRQQARGKTRRVATATLVGALALLTGVSRAEEPPKLAFVVGKVLVMDKADTVINNAVVLVSGGRIEKVGKANEMAIPQGYRRIDLPRHWIVPGFVDCHNHTAGSLSDLNDMVYLTNPGLDTLNTVQPESDDMWMARAGGVTTVLLIPGSGTNISGFGTISKTAGQSVSDVVVRSPGSIKVAQAGNPERYWWGVGRMFMNFNTRQTLEKAQAYHEAWEKFERGETTEKPAFDPIFDGFRGLFRKEFVASVHTQIYQVVMTTVDMLARKMDLRTVLDHSEFDGWKVAPLIREALAAGRSIYTIQGPRAYHLDGTQRKIHGNAARWWQAGNPLLGINTDAPVVAQEQLPFQAAMGCYYGWVPYEGIKGLTRIPAEALLLDDQIGTIEAGKQAEFGVWTGDPLDTRSACEMTVIGGRIVYDANVRRRW